MSQPPPTPRQKKVQEALDLFAQLQSVPFAISDDEQRVRHAANLERQQQATSAPSTSTNGKGNDKLNGSNTMLRKGTGIGGGAAPTVATTKQLNQQITELQRKLALSDALMKKLHRRNKELALEAEQLRQGDMSGKSVPQSSSAAPTTVNPNGELSANNLKAIITRRDQEIIALKKQLALAQQPQQNQATASVGLMAATSIGGTESSAATAATTSTTPRMSGGPSTTAQSATKGAPNASSSAGGSNNNNSYFPMPSTVPAEAQVGLLHKRIDSLQKDYQTLLDAKLDAIAQGESTGKVNKQVKVFFAALKAKMATDAADYEAERVLWHQRIASAMTRQ